MTLFIVSVPIGNPDDITIRAVNTMNEVDFLICEEYKVGRKLIKHLQIDKELIALNEHNESYTTEEIINRLQKSDDAALFSDAGTPLFADPGVELVKRCHELQIKVVPVPGPSSLMAALSVAGIKTDRFFYAGFLPRQSDTRRHEIRKLKDVPYPIVILDTPYRLGALVRDLKTELPSHRQIVLSLSLTKSDEQVIKGSISQIAARIERHPIKKEFVLIVEPEYQIRKSKKRVKSAK